MLDKISAVLLFERAGGYRPILGDLPPPAQLAKLKDLTQTRPAARKLGGGMVISVPLPQERWHIWVIDAVPAVTELADLLTHLQRLSSAFAEQADTDAKPSPLLLTSAPANRPTAPGQPADGALLARLVERIATHGPLKPSQLAQVLVRDVTDNGLAQSVMLFVVRAGKLRKHWESGPPLASHLDEIRLLVRQSLGEKPLQIQVSADSTQPEELESALLARQANVTSLTLILPPRSQNGYGLVAFGARVQAVEPLAQVPQVMTLNAPRTAPINARQKLVRRGVLLAAAVAGALFLAQPVPITIAATGTSEAAKAEVAALPADAFLLKTHVRVGQQVEKGAALADFNSPALAEQEAQERLQVSVEELNGQAALAQNNYGAYQIAQQRMEIAKVRLQQVLDRQAQLQVKAPGSGRIIQAISDASSGRFLPTGSDVAVIQTGPGYLLRLSLARMDAHLVTPGMTGRVYFRGLGRADYTLRVIAPAAIATDPRTGVETVEALAEVTSGDLDQLINGLAGYARLDGPRAPRVVGYGRYLSEFFRVKAWTYLGLHI